MLVTKAYLLHYEDYELYVQHASTCSTREDVETICEGWPPERNQRLALFSLEDGQAGYREEFAKFPY
jgi:hypothetical protein